MARPRELSNAYRAVYLASPLKFCTTNHAFTPVVPKYYINPWEKDPWAWQHHKLRRSRERKRGQFGAWCYVQGAVSSLSSSNAPPPGALSGAWPEPQLLGARGLVEVAQKAQVEKLEDFHFWEKVAERAVKLRDVVDVGDLAVLLDALLTANHRHIHLMKTLSRELIDDVDKLSLVEAAVIMNSFAHFQCESRGMFEAFAGHVTRLLMGQRYLELEDPERYGSGAADPQTLAVLCKAFAALKFKDDEMMKAVNAALIDRIEDANVSSISEILGAFCDLSMPFEAPVEFWVTLSGKIPGTSIRYLSPLLRALRLLEVFEPELCEAVGQELLQQLEDARQSVLPHPEVSSLPKLPSFAERPLVPSLEAAISVDKDATEVEDASPTEESEDFQVIASAAEEDEEEEEKQKTRRWYNAVTRKLDSGPKVPYFAPFDPDECFKRNLRGFRVAQALEGLEALRAVSESTLRGASGGDRGDTSEASEAVPQRSLHESLLDTVKPLVTSALQGLRPSQLALAAELYAAKGDNDGTVHLILRESLRRLSNFSRDDIRRLNAACVSCGLEDPYLARAQKRRFPKALRKELRTAVNGTAVT